MDFLGIGAQRSGSSWLDAVLREHSAFWLPPIKELHYFDRLADGPWQRLTGNQDSYRLAREALRRGGPAWRWHARYLLGRRSDAWYLSLFEPGAGRLRGEITPRYSILPEEGIAHVARLLPEVRILYLLRDPVERAWSNLRRGADRYGTPASWGEGDLRARLERSGVLTMGSYAQILARWERHLPAERILVACFEEIAEDPAGLLRRIGRFLGVGEGGPPPASLRATVNAERPAPLPPRLRALLAQHYLLDLRALHARLASPYTAAWLAAAEESGAT